MNSHKARAEKWTLGMTGTGKEQIVVFFRFIGGEFDGQGITWYGFFTDGTIDRTLDSLRHCGWAGDNIGELDGLDANEVELELEDDTYNGKTTTKVKWVNRLSGPSLKNQMDATQVRDFAARMRGRAAAHKLKYGGPAAAAAPRSGARPARAAGGGGGFDTPPPTDDDIPF